MHFLLYDKQSRDIDMEKKEYSSEADLPKDEFEELFQKLEKTNWDGHALVKYCGFWFQQLIFRAVYFSHKNFRARNTDIIVATTPKSGTTWLKALTFSIVKRNSYATGQTPLLTENPHTLVPFLEYTLYKEQDNPNLDDIPSPRLFSTHRSFNILADSLGESACKVIYICRNPFDQFISYWHFSRENKLGRDADALSIEEVFDDFCNGVFPFGPILDQALGYWTAHLKNPHKILFLKYEDLKEDVTFHVKKIAEFVGLPFTQEEEKLGRAEEISRLCSFASLSNLEVNKTGIINVMEIKNSSLFRKGVVGDWENYLTPEMSQRLIEIMDRKLEGSGLAFKIKS